MRYPRASHRQRLHVTLRVIFLIIQNDRLILGNNDVFLFIFDQNCRFLSQGEELYLTHATSTTCLDLPLAECHK